MQTRFTVGPGLAMKPRIAAADQIQLTPEVRNAILGTIFPRPGLGPFPPPAPPPAPAPTPAPAPPPAPIPVVVPPAPGSNPFDQLPFPAPGERIKADDFKTLSQALKIIADIAALTANLF